MGKTKFLYAKCIKNEGQWLANLYAEDDPRDNPILYILSARNVGFLILSIEEYAINNKRELVAITLIY